MCLGLDTAPTPRQTSHHPILDDSMATCQLSEWMSKSYTATRLKHRRTLDGRYMNAWKNGRLAAVLFAHAYQLRIDSKLDGTHCHRPIEMTLGFSADCGIHVVKAGINRQQHTTEDSQHKQQYDEQSVVRDGRASNSKTSKRIQNLCLRLQLSEMCNGWWEVRVQVQGVSEVLNGIMAPAACQVYLTNSEMLEPRVLLGRTRF